MWIWITDFSNLMSIEKAFAKLISLAVSFGVGLEPPSLKNSVQVSIQLGPMKAHIILKRDRESSVLLKWIKVAKSLNIKMLVPT